MQKIILKIFIFLILTASIPTFAVPPIEKKESKIEIRARLDKNNEENKFGDVVITNIPELSSVKKPSSQYLPINLGQLVAYVFPDMDLEDMYKLMPTLDSPNIDVVVGSIDKFLSKKNTNLKAMGYSQGTVRVLLDSGLPLFAYITADETAFEKIVKRNADRPTPKPVKFNKKTQKEDSEEKSTKNNKTTKNSKSTSTNKDSTADKETKESQREWVKILKKEAQKKFHSQDSTAFAALISGYNKDTREYQLKSTNFGTFWIEESELKASMLRLYQLRF